VVIKYSSLLLEKISLGNDVLGKFLTSLLLQSVVAFITKQYDILCLIKHNVC